MPLVTLNANPRVMSMLAQLPAAGGGLTVQWVASSAQSDGSGWGNDLVVPLPTGADGDLRFAHASGRTTGIPFDYTTPAGWTLLELKRSPSDSKAGSALYGRIKQSGDANTVTLVGSAGTFGSGAGHCFRPAPATYLDVIASSAGAGWSGATSQSLAAANITATVTDSVIVFAGISAASCTGLSTATAGWTEKFDALCSSNAASRKGLYIHNADDPAGSVTGPTIDFAGNPYDAGFCHTVGIKIA